MKCLHFLFSFVQKQLKKKILLNNNNNNQHQSNRLRQGSPTSWETVDTPRNYCD